MFASPNPPDLFRRPALVKPQSVSQPSVPAPHVTLGINYLGGPGHDSAAALAVDGRIVYAIAEERLTRKKQDASFPIEAIKACLDYGKVSIEELDEVVFGWPPLAEHFAASFKMAARGELDESLGINALNYVRSKVTRSAEGLLAEHGLRPRKVRFLDHHLAHAYSVVPYLEAERSLIFVVDGRGISECTTVYLKTGTAVEQVKRIDYPNSLGLFYAEMTSMCGFRKNADEWKVMGLAPFGKTRFDLDHLISAEGGDYKVNYKALRNVTELTLDGTKIRRPDNDEVAIDDADLRDLARSAQDAYEWTILQFMSYYVDLYGCKSIGMAGGVGLNCKANGFVMRELKLDEFFIQPAATDDGTAVGAALYPFAEAGTLVRERFDPYLGNEYTDEEIEAVLRKYKLNYTKPDNVAAAAARSLHEGKIVGWFQGRDEYGPRALGNRSILSNPTLPDMKDRVNEVVKYREGWRPFAPSMLESEATQWLGNISSSPYMILTDIATPEAAEKIPAVVHVDQTLRPQTVRAIDNARYFELLTEFKKLSGVGVVMNTSFNLKGEPNVSSPTDAVRTFFTSGLDVLYVGGWKVTKG